MVFNGAAGNENATMTAEAGRLTFFRVQGNVTMDTDGVEIVDFNALGGIDNLTVNDLTGTDVTQTNVDLAGPSAAAPATAQSTTWSSKERTASTRSTSPATRRGRM